MTLVLPLAVAVALLAVSLLLVVAVVVVVAAAAADPGCFPSCALLEEDRIDHKPLQCDKIPSTSVSSDLHRM